MDKVAAVTGSEKSPPGGETAPTIVTVPYIEENGGEWRRVIIDDMSNN